MASSRGGVVALCFCLVLAGCVGAGIDGDSGGATADGPAGPQPGETTLEVTVLAVVDGDTFDIRYANGTTDTVRMLGIDTPEVRGGNDPAEFEGVPDTEAGRSCLRSAGDAASAALRERLATGELTLVLDPLSDRRGDYGRLLAYVRVNGTDLNRWLVAEGYARVYDSTFSRSEAYDEAEATAQRAGAGLWTCRSPESADFGGGTGRDEAGHRYEFPVGFAIERRYS